MSRKKRHRLTPEDKKLWEAYASGVTARKKEDFASHATTEAPEDTKATPPKTPLPQFHVGESSHDRNATAMPAPKSTARPTPRMDAKKFGKMKQGRVRPDARIDLHGMTVTEAHTALNAFILSRQARGDRLALVITGKGREGGFALAERGILRRQVPHWLSIPPLAGAVLEVTPAHRRHGGDGALYVYLRRLR